MEIAVELKDNKVLRELKASKKTHLDGLVNDGVSCKSDSLFNNYVSEDQNKQSSVPRLNLEQLGSLQDDLLCPRKVQNCKPADYVDMDYTRGGPGTISHNKEENACSLINVDVSKSFMSVCEHLNPASKCKITEDVIVLKPTPKISNATSDMEKETSVRQETNTDVPLSSRTSVDSTPKTFAVDIDDDVTLLFDDVAKVEPTLNIRKESSTPLPPSNPGICSCFFQFDLNNAS